MLTITADSGYALPDSISVSGCTYTYNKDTGAISLRGASSDVVISAVGVEEITAITDLTGTTWVIDVNSIVIAGEFASFPTYNINFIGKGDKEFNAILSEYSNSYFIIKCRRVSDSASLQLAVVQTQYNPTSSTKLTVSPWSWTMQFTGGTDSTNTDLINWLQANATKQ